MQTTPSFSAHRWFIEWRSSALICPLWIITVLFRTLARREPFVLIYCEEKVRSGLPILCSLLCWCLLFLSQGKPRPKRCWWRSCCWFIHLIFWPVSTKHSHFIKRHRTLLLRCRQGWVFSQQDFTLLLHWPFLSQVSFQTWDVWGCRHANLFQHIFRFPTNTSRTWVLKYFHPWVTLGQYLCLKLRALHHCLYAGNRRCHVGVRNRFKLQKHEERIAKAWGSSSWQMISQQNMWQCRKFKIRNCLSLLEFWMFRQLRWVFYQSQSLKSSIKLLLFDFLSSIPIRSKVKNPLLNLFLIKIGESIRIGSPNFSKDLKGINWKIMLSDRFFVTSTENAPFFPVDGLIVPDK